MVTGDLKAGPSHVTEDSEESSQNTQGPSHLTIGVNSENPHGSKKVFDCGKSLKVVDLWYKEARKTRKAFFFPGPQ